MTSTRSKHPAPRRKAAPPPPKAPGWWLRLKAWVMGRPASTPGKLSGGASVTLLQEADMRTVRRAMRERLERDPTLKAHFLRLKPLERALRSETPVALESLPLEVIEQSLSDLEQVIDDAQPGVLGALRAKLSTALLVKGDMKRSAKSGGAKAKSGASDFDAPQSILVDEGSLTVFMAASQEWEATYPAPQESVLESQQRAAANGPGKKSA